MNGYFDNAATTYKKPEGMYAFIADYMTSYGANVGRGSYDVSRISGKLVADTRAKVLALVHAPEDCIAIFTPSATVALNYLIFGQEWKEGDVVYISPFEHNAVLRPLYLLQNKCGIQIKTIPMQEGNRYAVNLSSLENSLQREKVKAIIVSHVSNVLGITINVDEIGRIAHRYGVITIVDGAQACGIVDCDLHFVDYYVFEGHKTLLGPMGIGGFICKRNSSLTPLIYGGTGQDSANHDMPNTLPERFEPGTMNLMSVAGLHYSINWLQGHSQFVKVQEKKNIDCLHQILSKYPYLEIISPYPNVCSIISCKARGFTSDEFGKILIERGIAVRTGLHCAPKAHEYIGSFPEGLIRFSISAFTEEGDFETLRQVLDELSDEII